jgi:two-component system LytT family sensor kinase
MEAARIPTERIWKSKRLWLIGFAVWLTLAILDAPRQFAVFHIWKSVLTAGILWATWAAFAPVIIWLDRRVPALRDQLAKRLLLHVVFCIAVTTCTISIHIFAITKIFGPNPRAVWNYIGGHVQIYWAIAGIYIAYDYYTRFIERRLQATELERLLAEARLGALRAQLHPHFLFNALNAVSAQMDLDTRSARRMLEQVGELLRLSLANPDAQEISLDQELAFNIRYLELQKERYDDRLEFTKHIDPRVIEARVPPFVLQPLVENAIRHGIEKRVSGGLIEISAEKNDGQLVLRVRDNGPGMPPHSLTPQGFGIGLTNTRERLRHLYGEKEQSLTITSGPEQGTLVEIVIPFHSSASSAELY